MHNYILDGTTPVLEPDLLAWARWYATADRVVEQTEIAEGILVSTVFLGIDHQLPWLTGQPVLFETMVFGGPPSIHQRCWRYRTWQEAEQGHARVCAVLRRFFARKRR